MTIPAITVTGTYEDASGNPLSGTVTFILNAEITDGTTTIPRTKIVCPVDAEGRLLDPDTGDVGAVLYASEGVGIEPTGALYKVRERLTGAPRRTFFISLPSSPTTVDMSDLTPVDDTGVVWTDPATQAELAAEQAARSAADTALATAVADHLADTVDSHDASAVSVVPTGAIASTNVQSALAELDTEKSATSHLHDGTYVPFKTLAYNPDELIVGTITRDANGVATSAPVVWPDGTVGTYTADTVSTAFPGAVDGYHITYGSPVTRTYTQPTVTRDSNGAVTARPAVVIS